MEIILLTLVALAGTGLVIAGLWLDGRDHRVKTKSVIRPIQPPRVTAEAALPDLPGSPELAALPSVNGPAARIRHLITAHPVPLYGWLETVFWLIVLLSLIDHLQDRHDSLTARIAWMLTIGPHEIGHIICYPFGWTLGFLGGSIWQILWWLLLAVYVLLRYRRLTGALVFLAITGHSFLNLSLYIADARARDLPLLFGMDSSHHDWWNLLNRYGLLEYDRALGSLATLIGTLILVGVVIVGIVTAWVLPRRSPGSQPRYEGNPVRRRCGGG
ncbi:MAG: hypothetical protein JXQ72_14000 [Anaerolineae bacterium]|nr:hypothetical protein [Anaerolineae bacterium]